MSYYCLQSFLTFFNLFSVEDLAQDCVQGICDSKTDVYLHCISIIYDVITLKIWIINIVLTLWGIKCG